MIQATGNFNTEIKSNIRNIDAYIEIVGTSIVEITRDKIIGIDFEAQGEVALGCFENNLVTVKVIKDSISTEVWNTDIRIKIVISTSQDAYLKLGVFRSEYWKKGDDYDIIEFTNDFMDADITNIGYAENMQLSTYTCSVFADAVGLKDKVFNSGMKDCLLPTYYLYSRTIKEQLKSLGFATNTIAKTAINSSHNEDAVINFCKYYFSTPVDVLKEGSNELILKTSSNENDYIDKKKEIVVKKSRFLLEDLTSLYGATVRAEEEYIDYNIDFGSPSLVKYIHFPLYGYYSSFNYGLFGGVISIGSGAEGVEKKTSFSIMGSKITSNVLGSTTDNTKTYLSNPYIQKDAQLAALDTTIYTAKKMSLQYRGNPCLEVGDTITLENIGDLLITRHTLRFDGGLSGAIEGVLRDE